MEQKVIHEKENKRFIIYTDSGEAYVEYRLDNNEMDLYHTFTNPALRGKGLAALVARAALEFAKENNLKVIPTCPYIQTFISRNVEFKNLVEE